MSVTGPGGAPSIITARHRVAFFRGASAPTWRCRSERTVPVARGRLFPGSGWPTQPCPEAWATVRGPAPEREKDTLLSDESRKDGPDDPSRISRRRALVAAASMGVLGAASSVAVGEVVRHDDVTASRNRADGASLAENTSATTLKVLWRANTTQKVMSLTFDDGPGPTLTSPLLDALAEAKVRATFSLIGKRAYVHRDLVKRQMQAGHELANHTWNHRDLSQLDYSQQQSELERTDQLLYELTGTRPAMIRPPWGRVNGALLDHAARNNQHVLLWDMRFHENLYDSAGNAAWVLRTMRPGSVLLGHDAGSANRYIGTQAVPAIIKGAHAQGWQFLTASEMLALDT